MSSSCPVLSHAVPVSGGMVVAVPLELLASPLKNGRLLGDGDRSALVIGGTGKVRGGDAVVFCKVVAVAEAQVKRDGQVRAKGSPVHHATLPGHHHLRPLRAAHDRPLSPARPRPVTRGPHLHVPA